MNIKYSFLLFLLLSPFFGIGQDAGKDTVLRESVIEVLQSYKPKVRQAPKPEWMPQLPPADTTHPVFKYIVPQQSLYYSYHSDPLKPLALGKDTLPTPLPNYIKAGVGNLYTLFLDAGIGSFATPDYETFIHVHHISQKAPTKFEQSALTGIETEGFWHKDNNEWHATLNGERNQYYYYGYNHNLYDYSNSDSLKQTFTLIKANVDYKRKEIGDSKFDYQPGITASYYGAKFSTNELNLGFILPFSYDIDTAYQAHFNISGAVTSLKTDSPAIANNFIQFTPGLNINKGLLSGHSNIGLGIGKNGLVSILPDIEGDFKLSGTDFILSGGWMASIKQNTFEQLSNDNPYINSIYQLKQTRFDEIFVKMTGYYGSFNFSAKASWCNLKSLPTYLDTNGDGKQFNVVYDTVSAIFFQLGAKYIMANNYTIGLTGNFYEFYQGTEQYPWHIPNMKIKGDFAIKPIPKLTITAYLSLLSGIHAIDLNKKVVNLKTLTDIGCNAEYMINTQFNAFLQINNMLNSNNERWLGYNAYGINVYAGVRMKF